MKELTKFLNDINNINGSIAKKEYIKKYANERIKTFLSWYFDKTNCTGIAEKKYNNHVCFDDYYTIDILEVINYLKEHNAGSDKDIAFIKNSENVICQNELEHKYYKKIITKTLSIGIDSKSINEVFPNLVTTYDVMLANKYLDLPKDKIDKLTKNSNREFVIQTKYDGCRIIIHKCNGIVKCISRQGKLMTGLVEIEKAMLSSTMDNIVIDGELLICDRKRVPSTLQYKETMKIVNSKDDKTNLCVNAFDIMSCYEWNNHISNKSYCARYNDLNKFIQSIDDNYKRFIVLANNIYCGKDLSIIMPLLKKAKNEDEEGIMLRFNDSYYEWKRSNELLKIKPFKEMDLIIKSYESGTNKYENMLGAFNCEVTLSNGEHIKTKVGSGYSDDERKYFWENRDSLINRIISVQYFEITKNTKSNISSLRFPIFLELKEVGSEINN